MSPREIANDLGQTIKQFSPIRTAITALVLAFVTGSGVGAFFRSPLGSVRQANAAQDIAIEALESKVARHDSILLRIVPSITELQRMGCVQLSERDKSLFAACRP